MGIINTQNTVGKTIIKPSLSQLNITPLLVIYCPTDICLGDVKQNFKKGHQSQTNPQSLHEPPHKMESQPQAGGHKEHLSLLRPQLVQHQAQRHEGLPRAGHGGEVHGTAGQVGMDGVKLLLGGIGT